MSKSKQPPQESMQDYVPMSAQQEQDEVILAAMSVIPDAPETSKQNSQPSFAAGSKGLLSLKQELLAKGMSDEKAEAYLRQL